MSQSIHRRNFIKYCGSVAAGTAAANVVSAGTETPSSKGTGPSPKQEMNQEDFIFWRFHSTEHLPLGGRITRISDITFRIRLMLYPVGMGDVEDFRWDYGGPPTGREETGTFGAHQFYLTDDPITVRISRPGGILFNAVVEEIRRKEQRTVIRIEAGPQTRFYGLGGQFLGIEHSGREIECHSSDAWGEKVLRQPTWANTYYPIPYLFSTDGYALLFNATVPLRFEFPPRGDSSRQFTVEIYKGDDFYLTSRAGWAGMHQYAGALIGDMEGTFEGMRLALAAMQSFALSGQGVAAHNLGGYAGRQENTAFRRWVQLGVFSPLFAMWNSGGTGEPWSFDEETLAGYRTSALDTSETSSVPAVERPAQTASIDCDCSDRELTGIHP